MLVFPSSGFRYHDAGHELHVVEFDFHFFGGLLMFVLLILEIGDRVVMKRDLQIAREIPWAAARRCAADSRNLNCLYHVARQHGRRGLL